MWKKVNFQFLSQLLSSSISAILILNLIYLDKVNSNSWSFVYSAYLIQILLIRSIYSEPLIYSEKTTVNLSKICKILAKSVLIKFTITVFSFWITKNIFFFFIALPSLINSFQDFTRYFLIAQDNLIKLVLSDFIWFTGTVLLVIVFNFKRNSDSYLFFILGWCVFGVLSIALNWKSLSENSTTGSRELNVKKTLGLTLLVDKILPRIAGEIQFFVLNLQSPKMLAVYRMANLAMGFSNVLILSQVIGWISGRVSPIKVNWRQIFTRIIVLNGCIVIGLIIFKHDKLALIMLGLTIAAIQDIFITKRVIELRLNQRKEYFKSILMRLTSVTIVLAVFSFVLINFHNTFAISFAAAIGSLFSLITLLFIKL